MKKRDYKHHIEILPAALLSQRRAWQGKARCLPVGACLLITDPKNKEQTALMQSLTRSFRKKGKQVFLWAVKERVITLL